MASNLINVNQFAPLPTVGMCLNPSHGMRIEAEYYPAVAASTITPCVPCKFVAGVSNVNISVDTIAAGELPTAGVLIYDSSKRNVYSKGQYVTLARVNSIVLLTASAAVTVNQALTIAPAGTVAPAGDAAPVVGIALDTVAANQPVRVLFVEPYMTPAAAAGG